MANRFSFPQFDEEYSGKKMRQLVETLESAFNRSQRTAKKIATVDDTTAVYDCLADDDIIAVDRTTAGACTVNLPAARLFLGISLIINDRGGNASANNITVASADTINGSGTYVISTNHGSIILDSDGETWIVSAKF